MKRIINICIVIILCLSLAACSAVSVDVAKIDKEETYPEASASMAVIYKSFDEIIEDSKYIVEVEVLDPKTVMLDGFPQTHSKVKVLDVQKGDLNIGDEIVVVEEGGVTEDKGEAILGVPALKKGQKLVLFLWEKYEGKYYPAGAFQGKFIEREGHVFQQATEDVKLKDYQPKEIKNFKEDVKKTVEKLKKDNPDKTDKTNTTDAANTTTTIDKETESTETEN